jgi:hypothetical protein
VSEDREEIHLTDDEEAALERAWAKLDAGGEHPLPPPGGTDYTKPLRGEEGEASQA